jgi:diguanylate cyclase (GGDEF)-like protein
MEDAFPFEDCQAMSCSRPHEVLDPTNSLRCTHFAHFPALGHLCLPLTVQGETLAVLHLAAATGSADDPVDRRRLGVTVGEAIKICLAGLKLRRKLQEQATRDLLTGLFNRRYLEETLPRELHRTLRRRASLCVAMVDLDTFKRFNDDFGHDAGDAALRATGRVLTANLRQGDIACRYGGEEFVLVLPDSSLRDTGLRLEQIRLRFEELDLRHEGQQLAKITFSAGVVSAPEHGSNAEELLRAADEALYAAKRAGRNRVVAYQRS